MYTYYLFTTESPRHMDARRVAFFLCERCVLCDFGVKFSAVKMFEIGMGTESMLASNFELNAF